MPFRITSWIPDGDSFCVPTMNLKLLAMERLSQDMRLPLSTQNSDRPLVTEDMRPLGRESNLALQQVNRPLSGVRDNYYSGRVEHELW